MDKDEKLIQFMSASGQEIDPDVAASLLEAFDWNLEAALNSVLAPPPGPPADEVRAPMRTNYNETLLPGPGQHHDPHQDELARAMAESMRDHEMYERNRGQTSNSMNDNETGAQGMSRIVPDIVSRGLSSIWNTIGGGSPGPANAPPPLTESDVDVNAGASSNAMDASADRDNEGSGACSSSAPAPDNSKRAKMNEEPASVPTSSTTAQPSAPVPEEIPGQVLGGSVTWSPEDASAAEERWLKAMEERQRQGEIEHAAQQAQREREAKNTPPAETAPPKSVPATSSPAPQASKRNANAPPPPQKSPEEMERNQNILRCLQLLRKLDVKKRKPIMELLHAYITNIAKYPLEVKYHRINTENKKYQEICAHEPICEELLGNVGFKRDGSFLVMDPAFAKNKGSFVWDVLAKIDVLRR